MPLPPPLVVMARRKAACVRHYGADDPRTTAVTSQLRVARLLHEIETSLTSAERDELLGELATSR